MRIIPKPVNTTLNSGIFNLDGSTQIVESYKNEKLSYVVAEINRITKLIIGSELKSMYSQKATPESNTINLMNDSSLAEEQYTMNIQPTHIDIWSSTPCGAFYAIQSLQQMIPIETLTIDNLRSVEFPCCYISDKPHFAYRGMMIDVCRYFFSVEDIKEVLDMLAMHKLNRMHWHLTEDQGWRIEIKKYPRLTEIGSIRKETKIGSHKDLTLGYDGIPHGGFYTQAQIREIVAYAATKFITIIPEIELPGHAVAALASYPHLGCDGKQHEVKTTWGVDERVFCAGKESTYQFWEDVLSEVIELFPSEYIHIGGDECPKQSWKECSDCQAKIKTEGLADEDELQSYVTNRVEQFLLARGKKIIGWEEILRGSKISPSATVMSWRDVDCGIEAARMGNDTIMSPATHCYLDYYKTEAIETEPLAIGGFLPLDEVYSFDPYGGVSKDDRKYIIGIQGNVWTEYISTLTHLQYMALPRLSAIAEIGWSYEEVKDYDNFLERALNLTKFYDYYGFNYGTHPFEK